MNKCTMRGANIVCMGANLSYFDCICSYAWLAVIITPSPKQGPSTISMGWEEAQGGR